VIPLLSTYSAMTILSNGTSSTTGGTSSSSPQSFNYSQSYSTVYVSSTTYKISITTSEGGQSFTSTVWILKNGTTLAINEAGTNLTGSLARQIGASSFVGFTLQIQADSQINQYTSSNYFHSTGTSTVSIGPTQVSVTTYAANSLPVTTTDCVTGDVTTLTAYSFSVGTPHGSSLPLVTHEHFAGTTVQTNGQTSTFDEVLQLISITLA
jgi:hypothetical protein